MESANHPAYKLSEIWIYPVKSLGGISLQEAIPEPRGLRYDRRWMLVNKEGQFVTQREIPRMALLGTAIESTAIKVFLKGHPAESVQIPLDSDPLNLLEQEVQIWNDRCTARLMPQAINEWFSEQLGQHLRLFFMPESTRRPADERFAPPGHHVSFADGYPYLIIGQSSLDELNRRLPSPVPMNRFRPNFVFTGGEAFVEDTWKHLSIGQQPFHCVKPCARCILPNTDQDTAARSVEPLKTLKAFRKVDNRILFGQNVLWTGQSPAHLRVGDRILL